MKTRMVVLGAGFGGLELTTILSEAFGDVMDIVQLAVMLGPLLGVTAGYLVDGVTGATSGFVVSIGPLVLAWLFGSR